MRPEVLLVFVPIAAIMMGLGTGMLSLVLNYRKRRDMFALYHEERMAAIDKGIELPPLPEDFFHGDVRPAGRPSHGTLLAGLILLFTGAALYIALHFTVERTETGGDVALFALIPVGIGAACLVYYLAVGRKMAAVLEEERKARLADPTTLRSARA